jgi:hypothetical protein
MLSLVFLRPITAPAKPVAERCRQRRTEASIGQGRRASSRLGQGIRDVVSLVREEECFRRIPLDYYRAVDRAPFSI